jgi:hypothetical protein
MNLMLETRLQTLESRQGAAENNYVNIDKKGESSSHFITEIMDKMESKLQNMEMAVQILNNEHKREKDNFSRLEVNSLKNNDEFKGVLGQLQQEMQGRIELKVTDLVNRLMMEQDDRMRGHDEIKYQLEVKDKMYNDKAKYEREEMRDRYS